MKYNILLVDDDNHVWEATRRILQGELPDYDIDLHCLKSGEEAIKEVALNPDKYVVVIVDHDLASARKDLSAESRAKLLNGVETATQILRRNTNIQIVMQSGDKTRELVIEVMGLGITSFIDKPAEPSVVAKVLKSYFYRYDKHLRTYEPAENSNIEKQDFISSISESMIGQSGEMYSICQRVDSLRDSDSRVLITGENGTGKELLARAIHENSTRKNGPFVAVNVGAINSNLIESEMFGHEKGAFTGALKRRVGRFQQASGGTLFLDEIGELPLDLQAKLLRVLQENEIEIVGGDRPIPIDTRVVAATNVNLEEAVEVGRFRADLYHRLKVVPIKIPPLRERTEDIPLLVQEAIKRRWPVSKSMKQSVFDVLMNYSWPGNVRELMNLMERLASVPSDIVSEEYLDARMLNESEDNRESVHLLDGEEGFSNFSDIEVIQKKLEKKFIVKNLPKYNSMRSAAKGLELSNSSLRRKIIEYNIDADSFFSKGEQPTLKGGQA